MNTRNKKNHADLPFTQLWYNFKGGNSSKQSNKPNPKSKNPKEPKHDHDLFSSDLYPAKQRRASLTYLSKRPQINERASMMILPLDKQNCELNNMTSMYDAEQCNTSGINTHHNNNKNSKIMKDDYQYRNSSLSSHQNQNKNKNKVTDQILQVVERNIIPFLVDKFIETEARMNTSVGRLEEIINRQNEEIIKLKEREKVLQEVLTKMDRRIEGLDERQGSNKDRQTYYQDKERCYRAMEEKNKETDDKEKGGKAKKAITEINDQSEAGIKQISRLLQQLTLTMQKSAGKNTQQVSSLQKQVKKICERQKISEQKLEKQFASRILELITTYNDNFVDLDKRISCVENVKNEKYSMKGLSLGKIVSITSDKQKTNRHE